MDRYYAHNKKGYQPEKWHDLENHLKSVAELSHLFAESFGGGEWAYLAGMWHDIGKYSQEFQDRILAAQDINGHIETKVGRPDHSTAGAQHAHKALGDNGKLLAYTIAGHHAGLPDGKSNENSCLVSRLYKKIPDYSTCPERILDLTGPNDLPFSFEQKRFGFQLFFFAKMIFSCLVDADFLDTEAFINPERSSWRNGYPALRSLNENLTSALNRLKKKAPRSPINSHREAILEQCINAAKWKPGLFSLTVPTGGGKTLSSLAFALKHAIKYDLQRIIYVIPYTSIIEQNAAVFRNILGNDAVLEHHSNYEPKEENHRSRLAFENWDAPLVVTTNVQFFESLFSSRPSVCRKIHRIARSVVILDESQMLPVSLLRPSLEALKELSSAYRTTILLCTATQPALSTSDSFKDGLEGVREIISNPIQLYKTFKRIHVHQLHGLTDDKLVERLRDLDQVLCIVNTRKHARLIYEKLQKIGGSFHLSALMCPAHRAQELERIRKALNNSETCRVISTQLVEAGVDIDFPVVFRSSAGIDSIAQAAGRCNREGKLSSYGQVFIFSSEHGLPPGFLRQTAEISETVLRHHEDPLTTEAVYEYFKSLYWQQGAQLDAYQILADISEGAMRGDFPFRLIDRKFKIIKDIMQSIIIPWNEEAKKIIHELHYNDYPGALARKAQRFTVQVRQMDLRNLENAGSIEQLHDQYYILLNMDIYRDDLGLCIDNPGFHQINNLIV